FDTWQIDPTFLAVKNHLKIIKSLKMLHLFSKSLDRYIRRPYGLFWLKTYKHFMLLTSNIAHFQLFFKLGHVNWNRYRSLT
ncbi:hypothetical protein BLOT_002292, partial [Blomia tropicalis]